MFSGGQKQIEMPPAVHSVLKPHELLQKEDTTAGSADPEVTPRARVHWSVYDCVNLEQPLT